MAPRHTTPVGFLLAAALFSASAAPATASTATDPATPTVLFGDSVVANPTPTEYLAGQVADAGIPVPVTHSLHGCPTDGRLADSLTAASGTPTANYSCAGGSLYAGETRVVDQVADAAARGDLSADTREVVLLAGANDTYDPLLDGVSLEEMESRLTDAVVSVVAQIREAAPDARVKVVGYPRITDDAGQVCLVNVVPGAPLPGTPDVGLPPIADIEDALQRAQSAGAAASGAVFVDLKGPSRTSPMCSDDRWMAGIVDTTAGPHNLPLHATDAALDRMGPIIISAV